MSNEQDEHNHQNNSDDLGSDPDVPIVHLPPPEHPHHPTIEARHSHHYAERGIESIREYWSSSVVSAIASLITAFATVWMVVVYIQISAIMQSSSVQTDRLIRAGEIQAKSAENFSDSAYWMEQHVKDGAAAIQDSVDTADRNTKAAISNAENKFRQEQRAWLGVAHGPDPDYSSVPIRVFFRMINTGRSPAMNVIHIPNRKMWLGIGPPDPVLYKTTIPSIPLPMGTLPPGIVLDESLEFSFANLNISEPGAITSTGIGSRTIIVYSGIITYDDVFKGHHWTKYCYYAVAPIPFYQRGVRTGFCPYGNDTDDDPHPLPKEGAPIMYP